MQTMFAIVDLLEDTKGGETEQKDGRKWIILKCINICMGNKTQWNTLETIWGKRE
jgi:hypothetical protein